jgi:hypothetical protein
MYLDKRIPNKFQEVRFSGLAEHHITTVLSYFNGVPSCPEDLNELELFNEIQMVGVRDRLANIKMEFSSAWACVQTVRGKQCPANLLELRELTDEAIAVRALTKFVGLGLITNEDISWAYHVAARFGEVTTEFDENSIKHWEENKKRDKQMDSNDLEYQDTEVNVDIDDPIDRPAPVKDEAKFTTEGQFGQVQILTPISDGLQFDFWVEFRVNKFDGSPYSDPKARTRSAILAAVRELFDRTFVVRGDKLVWKFAGFGINKELTAAATRTKSPKAPWKIALPMEMVYRHLGAKDDAFGELLNIVKSVQLGCTKIEGKINWKSKQRMIRMWHVLKANTEFIPKHLVINIWIHKDEEWRVALGLPSAPAAGPAPRQVVRPQTVPAPTVRACRDCGTLIRGADHPGQFIIGREEHDGLCIRCLHKVAPITMDLVPCPDCGKENVYGVTCWCKAHVNGSTDGQLPNAAG